MITIETIKRMVTALDELGITDSRDSDTVNAIRSEATCRVVWSRATAKHTAHMLMDIRDREIERYRRALLRDDELARWVIELNGGSK